MFQWKFRSWVHHLEFLLPVGPHSNPNGSFGFSFRRPFPTMYEMLYYSMSKAKIEVLRRSKPQVTRNLLILHDYYHVICLIAVRGLRVHNVSIRPVPSPNFLTRTRPVAKKSIQSVPNPRVYSYPYFTHGLAGLACHSSITWSHQTLEHCENYIGCMMKSRIIVTWQIDKLLPKLIRNNEHKNTTV